MMVGRRYVTLPVVVLVLAVAAGSVGATPVVVPKPPRQPPPITAMPKGPSSSCTMTGPAWTLWGVHTPNAPPRHGDQYQVNAWGIPCSKAKELVRTFFPKVPPHSTGKLAGGPKGFSCKGGASGLTKNRMYAGSCRRLTPATTFDWGPRG